MMNVLKHPSFFRPTSRPPSPSSTTTTASPSSTTTTASPPTSRPSSSNGFDRAPRSLNKLSLSNFRRHSPSPSLALNNTTTTTLVQDGSYLELLSLKLSEAVSKALAQPTGPAVANEQLSGKRPIPQGRGHALGALIASELKATQDSPHLHKAILRSLHRPLSVLLTNLSAHLLPLVSSPAFQHAPPPTAQFPTANPTQAHAIALATFIGELLETFDQLDLGTDSDIRGDGLKSIREGLVSLINRIVGPLVTAIRHDLIPLLESLESTNVQQCPTPKAMPGAKPPTVLHPSIVTLQSLVPLYAKAIARYTTSTSSQAILATFLISIVWRGLVALAHRPYVVPDSPPTSPALIPIAIKKSRSSITPPLTPVAGRFIKLPPSRPPSPPAQPFPASAAADARALFDLFCLFPRPSGKQGAGNLAREVVDDAFDALKALPALLDAVHSLPLSLGSQHRLNDVAQELEILATDIPLLIALPVVLQTRTGSLSISNMVGLSEDQYRRECLSGFGRAEDCSAPIALRVRDALVTNPDAHPVVSTWLEMEIVEALEQHSCGIN